MPTYLQLCQSVSRESGTIDGSNQPASVTGQVGRLNKVVVWTAEAWTRIQNLHASWRFRRQQFSAALLANTQDYTAAALNIADLLQWRPVNPQEPHNITIYDPAIGVSDETRLQFLPWSIFRRVYKFGQQDAQRPTHYTVKPDNSLSFGPVPDKPYMAQGEYIRTAQVLAANGDIPICPADYHNTIVNLAIQLLAEHDEGEWQAGTAAIRYSEQLRSMASTELPQAVIGGPLA